MRLYVDKALVSSKESGAGFTDQITPVLFGAEHTACGTDGHFTGLIEQVTSHSPLSFLAFPLHPSLPFPLQAYIDWKALF